MPSSRANLPCGRSYAAARAKYVKKDVMVGVTYRVRAEEVEEATDNDETNNSFDGTAAVAVVEDGRHRSTRRRKSGRPGGPFGGGMVMRGLWLLPASLALPSAAGVILLVSSSACTAYSSL